MDAGSTGLLAESGGMRIGTVAAVAVGTVGLGLCIVEAVVAGPSLATLQHLGLYIVLAGGIDFLDQGLRSGSLLLPHGWLRRADHPVAYWCFAAFYLLLFPAMILGLIALQVDVLS